MHTYAAFLKKFYGMILCILIVDWQLLLILYCGFCLFFPMTTFLKEKIMMVLTGEKNVTCYKGR